MIVKANWPCSLSTNYMLESSLKCIKIECVTEIGEIGAKMLVPEMFLPRVLNARRCVDVDMPKIFTVIQHTSSACFSSVLFDGAKK